MRGLRNFAPFLGADVAGDRVSGQACWSSPGIVRCDTTVLSRCFNVERPETKSHPQDLLDRNDFIASQIAALCAAVFRLCLGMSHRKKRIC
jgi:hypothetical protein